MDTTNPKLFLAEQLLEKTNCSFFLTGKAGTGKSTFIKNIQAKSDKNIVCLAPTGISAINISGSTVHSFFGLPLRTLLPNDPGIPIFRKSHPKRKIIEKLDTLVIDEVSMIRADILDAIDTSLRRNTHIDEPFGGKQVVLIGDLFQLEPVINQNAQDPNNLMEFYETPFFFSANVLKDIDLMKIELDKIYRQQDELFIHLLNQIRTNTADEETLEQLNARYAPEQDGYKDGSYTITLTSTNAAAFTVNTTRLNGLSSRVYEYSSEVNGDFPENRYPTTPKLLLKEGAQVMFIRNDVDKRYVNGTIGKVIRLSDDIVEVLLDNGDTVSVSKVSWENTEYTVNTELNKIEQNVKGIFKQYPLVLAWAVTIHKSQGLTFDSVIIDLGRGAFAGGQVYVALSRCRKLEGITLKTPIKPKDIFFHESIVNFCSRTTPEEDIEYCIQNPFFM